MNPSTFNPANLPRPAPRLQNPVPPMRTPHLTAPLNIQTTRLGENPSQKPHASDEEQVSNEQDIYEKYFGKNFGTGKRYVEKGYGGGLFEGHKVRGLEQQMRRFAKNRSMNGKNLSEKDIEYISEEIGKTLQSIQTSESQNSTDRSIPIQKQKKLLYDLYWNGVKKGKISHEDFKDAREIVKNIKI